MLLGHPVQDIGWLTAKSIVERALPEDQSLEFKCEAYNNSDKSKHELCKDIAGLANASGGLIVIGVTEDAQNAAEGLAPVNRTPGDEVTRMHQVVLAGIEPMIPDLAIWESFDTDPATTEPRRIIFVLVPDSTAGPHGVRRDDTYRWPVRHDRATRWMREPELAATYRDRFRTAYDAEERVTQLHRASKGALDESGICWVALSCVPTRAGHLPADRELYRAWLSSAMEDLPFAISTATTALGRRRIVFTDQHPYSGISRDRHIELHADGAAFAAVAVTLRDRIDPRHVPRSDHVPFDTDAVIYLTLSLLAVLARHAANTGAGGELNLVAQIVGAYSDPRLARMSIGRVPLVATEPYADGSGTFAGPRVIPGSMPVKEPTALAVTLPIATAFDNTSLVGAAAEIVHELIAEFGSSVTEPVLSTGGVIQHRSFVASLGPLVGWARDRGLLRP